MKIPYIYIGAAALLCTLASCDNIKEDDRLIAVPRPHSDKVMLIEEFTGANCPNCPTGAEMVASLHEQYGHSVIPVSLYPSNAGNLTEPQSPIRVDLRTELASTYYSAFNVQNLPAAMFDRTTLDNGTRYSNVIQSWGAPVAAILAKSSPVEITMTKSYDEATRELTASYDVNFLDGYAGEVSFQLWVLENGIIASQTGPNGKLPMYEHNHVLRASMNGTWGTAFTDTENYLPSATLSGSASITLAADWKAENCQVVGFLFNNKTREIIQAHLVESITE